MSGSSSRFTGRGEPAMPLPGYDSFDDPVTGVSSRTSGYPPYPEPTLTTEDPQREMRAPSRDRERSRKMKVTAPVVPPGSVTGRSLTLVIAIMCFLACLTAGAVWMIKESSDAWLSDIASEVTVQVVPQDSGDVDKTVADVVSYLQKQPGIANVNAMSLDQSAALLQPWLGSSDVLKSLPVPRLIAVQVDRTNPPDLGRVADALTKTFKGASLDDHRRWQQQIRAVTRSFALGGLAILALVGAATTAIIVSATRSAMASNREIVEVLHFVGATDKFISREFEKHFLRLGIKAGIVGAAFAMLVFMSMPAITELLGGGAVSAVEMQRLIGTGALDALGYVILGFVVVTIAGLCMVTSRVGVYRILNGRH
ncbi:MAG: ABC transporter permease [Proteobacteria bacterium]|nr:ABC transporter permease [Pseudomonadota bacterium]